MKLRVKCRAIGSLCIFLFLLLLVLLSLPSSASLCTILLFCGNTGNRTNPCIYSEGSWDRARSPISSTQGCCWVGLCPPGRAAKANKNQHWHQSGRHGLPRREFSPGGERLLFEPVPR